MWGQCSPYWGNNLWSTPTSECPAKLQLFQPGCGNRHCSYPVIPCVRALYSALCPFVGALPSLTLGLIPLNTWGGVGGTFCRSSDFYVQFSLWCPVLVNSSCLCPSRLSGPSPQLGTRLHVGFPPCTAAWNFSQGSKLGHSWYWPHLFSFCSLFISLWLTYFILFWFHTEE